MPPIGRGRTLCSTGKNPPWGGVLRTAGAFFAHVELAQRTGNAAARCMETGGQPGLEGGQVRHGPVEVVGLRQYGVLQQRLVGDKGVAPGYAAHRRIQIVK